MLLIEKNKTIVWSGRTSGRWELKRWSQEVCVSCRRLFNFTFSLPMPCNAIHYSSTTWTITFGGCRIDVFDLMFCCCHSFLCVYVCFCYKEVLLELTFSPEFVSVCKHWIDGNDRLINTDDTSRKVWYRLKE